MADDKYQVQAELRAAQLSIVPILHFSFLVKFFLCFFPLSVLTHP